MALIPKARLTFGGTVLALCLGCADGPFGLARYNPVLRKEWEQDEKFGPTLPQKLEELAALRNQAPSLPPADQERLSRELADVIKTESNALLCAASVRTIAVFPTAPSVEALRFAITHGDPDVRTAACDGWRLKESPEALQALAQVLGSDTDPDVRIVAAKNLEAFRDPAAIQALALALEENDPALQHRAVQSLKKVTGRDFGNSVPAWQEYVRDGNPQPAEGPSLVERLRRYF